MRILQTIYCFLFIACASASKDREPSSQVDSVLIEQTVLRTDCQPVRSLKFCDSHNGNCKQTALAMFETYVNSIGSCTFQKALPRILFADPSVVQPKSILIVHGLTDTPYSFLSLGELFQKKGYNVILMVLSGHGGLDEYLVTQASYKAWVQDVEFGVKVASMLGESVEALGHSTGGAYLVHYAMRDESARIKRLYLLDPAVKNNGTESSMTGLSCPTSKVAKYLETVEPKVNMVRGKLSVVANAIVPSANATEARKRLPPLPKICRESIISTMQLPLAGACALYKVQKEIKGVSNYTQRLPPSIVLLTADDTRYAEMTNNGKVADEFAVAEKHQIQFIRGTYHGYMGDLNPDCNPAVNEVLHHLGLVNTP